TVRLRHGTPPLGWVTGIVGLFYQERRRVTRIRPHGFFHGPAAPRPWSDYRCRSRKSSLWSGHRLRTGANLGREQPVLVCHRPQGDADICFPPDVLRCDLLREGCRSRVGRAEKGSTLEELPDRLAVREDRDWPAERVREGLARVNAQVAVDRGQKVLGRHRAV